MNQLATFSNPSKPDPKIEQSLLRTSEFLRAYEPKPDPRAKDVLAGQYQIDLSTPLPQFNTGRARAFAAVDTSEGAELFALICEPGTAQRHDVIQKLLTLRHPALCSLVAAGVVPLSQPAEERYVLFYERVKGQKLSTMLAATRLRIPPHIIIGRIISPIAQAIVALEEAGITHGSINPDNIYYDNGSILGPCVTDPCGYHQYYYYETVERMQAHPGGKGAFQEGVDLYALAVLTLQITNGLPALERYNAENLARAILRQGPFMALTAGRDVPEDFFDYFWGMLGSGMNKRWTHRYLKPWLEGKHYNIIPSPPPADSSKPYECFGTQAYSRREIAQLIRTNWDKVKENLAKASLPQWIVMAVRQKELSEQTATHARIIVESPAKEETQRNAHIMHLLRILDEHGPIQYGRLAFHPDGISSLFADLYVRQQQEELQLLVKFIDQNLISAWLEMKHNKEVELPENLIQFFARLDRIRSTLRNTGFGFGLERLLYDLNPEMPCLSPLCRGRHITTLPGLLQYLNEIAANTASNQDPVDAHIAAFIASKLGLSNEVSLYDLMAVPDLAKNKTLIALKLFAVAQHRSGNIELSGLTHWVAQRILPSMHHLRSNSMRSKTLQMLLDQATEGRTQRLGDLLLDGEIVNADQNGFQKALISYKRNADRIEGYRKAVNLDRDSAYLGGIIAKIFAYGALIYSGYNIYIAYQ